MVSQQITILREFLFVILLFLWNWEITFYQFFLSFISALCRIVLKGYPLVDNGATYTSFHVGVEYE